jgi:DNA-binding protein HU-beta
LKPTFANLVAATAETAQLTKKDTLRVLREFFRHVSEGAWAAGQVKIPGFITLRAGTRKARRIRNPQTHELMDLPARRVMVARVVSGWRNR